MTWIGTKRIAFIPVYRTVTLPDPPDVIPSDWSGDILRRALNDPDPTTGADRSLRAYIRATSSGRADLEATVMPMVTVDRKDVRLDHADMQQLAQQMRDKGFDAAAIVMLGGPGAGTGQEGGFLARFAMVEKLGTWAMELMHVLTGFTDIRCRPGFTDCEGGVRDIGNFDEMAFNGGMHPTAYTKAAIQWLDASVIAHHTGRIGGYELHAVGLNQPPPSGRVAAVRIGSQIPYLMAEARLKVDQFESRSQVEPGIPSEGVIVYRVQTSDPLGHPQNNHIPLYLLTPVALTAGQSVVSDTGVAVTVTGSRPDGFSILVEDRSAPFDHGQLLSYGDNGTPGNVSDPVVVGFGGWADFKALFTRGDRIYAVDQGGQLLSYGDNGNPGNVSSPVVVGFGGWGDFRALFAGGRPDLCGRPSRPTAVLRRQRDARQRVGPGRGGLRWLGRLQGALHGARSHLRRRPSRPTAVLRRQRDTGQRVGSRGRRLRWLGRLQSAVRGGRPDLRGDALIPRA